MLMKPDYDTPPHMQVHEIDKSGGLWSDNPHLYIAGYHPHSYHRNSSLCHETHIGRLSKYECQGHGVSLKQRSSKFFGSVSACKKQ